MKKGVQFSREDLNRFVQKGLVTQADLERLRLQSSTQTESSRSAPLSLAPSETSKPECRLNKTEKEYLMRLQAGGWEKLETHTLKLRVGPDGQRCWYTPDFTAVNPLSQMFTLFEVKGGYEFEDARVKRMAAARLCQRFGWGFVFAQKIAGRWTEEGLA